MAFTLGKAPPIQMHQCSEEVPRPPVSPPSLQGEIQGACSHYALREETRDQTVEMITS